MAEPKLVPSYVGIGSPVFAAIRGWAFTDEFVARLLADDIPQRVNYGHGRVQVYTDTESNLVAFGTLDICADCGAFTDGKIHTYIPLLAVHPDHQGKGYGKAVVNHLVSDAACVVAELPGLLHPAVFLDVYEESHKAISLYKACGFQALGSGAIVDPANGKPYHVMAKRVL